MMRLRDLTLDRFGHFTGQRLDFGPGGESGDFHIVYGPNEAGKTTTMEAALRLFYGFPLREPYDFLHQRKALQVSATLEIDGQAQVFTRLPTRAGTLTDGNGLPLPEAALAGHLGGLTLSDYRQLLCLDDATIEAGGEEIVAARGDAGRLLFSAAAGISDLSTVLDRLRTEADALYRKRGSATELATLKRELEKVEKTIRDTDITATGWRKLRHALTEAQAEEAQAREDRDTLRSEAGRLGALVDALPMRAEIDRLDILLAPLADYPDRLDMDPESLVRLMTDQTRAEADAERLTAEIAEAEATRDAIRSDPDALALGDAFDALDPLLTRFRAAEPDLPRRLREMQEAEADMASALRDLALPEGTDAQRLVLSPADLARLEDAREALRNARRSAIAEDEECARLAERLAEAEAASGAETPGTPVADLLDRHAADALAPAFAAARAAIAAAADRAADALHALARPGTAFATLPPAPETVAEARARASRHAALLQEIAATGAERDTQRNEVALHAVGIRHMAATLVPDRDAQEARAERDRLWQAHRAAPDAASADAFEAAMRSLDALSDSRLAQARDLGQLRAAEQTQAKAEARAEAAENRLSQLETERDTLETATGRAAATLGLTLLPADWADWLDRHATATEAQRQLDRLQENHAGTLRKADALTLALDGLLDLEGPDFDTAIAAARSRAAAERKAAEDDRAARQALHTLRHDLSRRGARRDAAHAALDQALTDWTALVCGLSTALDPARLEASLDPLRRLRERDGTRAQAARQVAGMEADRARFAAAVTTLAERLNLSPVEPETAHAALGSRIDAARAARQQHEAVAQILTDRTTRLRDARARLDTIRREIVTLGALFPPSVPVPDLAALRAAVSTAQEAIETRALRGRTEIALKAKLAVPSLPEARALLEGLTETGLATRAETLECDLAAAETRLRAATEASINAARDLRALTDGADIAALTERKATLELQIEDTALRHLEMSFGHRLADEAIRRFRDTHRSAMMQATEAAFSDLTAGAYGGLRTQPDGQAETLLAIDRSGAAKQVQDLSKGTRFQLYLALRAAAHAQMAQQGVILPFFCDDIFETFDEDRTRAACTLLERIGRTGQAIYLTHHRHVVEIARTTCVTPPRIHELPRPR